MDETALRKSANEYIKWETNESCRAEIKKLLAQGDLSTLEKRLSAHLEFGTAGLRGPMVAGYNALNELTVVQATQGLALYLEETFGAALSEGGGVALGWDHRANLSCNLSSGKYALLAAEVLVRRGIRVSLLPGLVHTPMVSYCVLQRKCKAGIMITASHNPKEDNGYKVYWDNGAQIVPPHDKGIAKCIEKSYEPWAKYGGFESHEALAAKFGSALLSVHTEELAPQYFDTMAQTLCRYPQENATSPVKIVYTAMHGIGAPWFMRGFEAFNLPAPIPVDEQHQPDPTFPTVAFPNPEEGAGALELAFATAERHGATLVLANDPDADRLAVAEKGSDGTWKVLTGNEIGILLADWEWNQYKRANVKKPKNGKKAAMLCSAVSSHMIKALAQAEGFYWEETLTGFKWLCSRSVDLRAQGYEVLFAYEEAIGFCVGSLVHDKDGVSAGAVFGEMAAYLARTHNRTICGHLDYLFERLGQFTQNNGYIICRQPKTTAAIFDRLRNGGHYWLLVNGERIVGVRDLTTGVDTEASDGKAKLPLSSSSHMITYRFANGATATLRGSGTEPKIKWYAEMVGKNRKDTISRLSALVDAIIEEMLQPDLNGLERRK